MERTNIHASAAVLGRTGVIIVGPSGAGKSSLALALVDLCRARFAFSSLVSDDQVWIGVEAGRLIAQAPDPIAGLVELRGYGPASVAFERRAVIDRVVALVDAAAAPRYRRGEARTILGVDLPCLDLPARNAAGNARAVAAWIEADADS